MAYANVLTAITPDPPAGWLVNGSDVPNYEVIVDTTVKHSGKASARIKFIAGKADGFGGLMQCSRLMIITENACGCQRG